MKILKMVLISGACLFGVTNSALTGELKDACIEAVSTTGIASGYQVIDNQEACACLETQVAGNESLTAELIASTKIEDPDERVAQYSPEAMTAVNVCWPAEG